MSKLLKAVFALAILLGVGPVAAQPPARTPEPAGAQLEEALEFVGQLGEVTRIQVEAMKKLLDSKPLLDRMATPAGARAAAPRIRLLMSEARGVMERADAMTAGLAPPAGLRLSGLDPATMIAEARSQNKKGLALLADFDSFLVAAEKGDRAALTRAAPRLMEGSFLLIDGNAAIYRNRKAAIPSNQSVHQALEIGIQLYRAMSASGRAWLAARTGAPAGAADTLRLQLGEIAGRTRAATAEGRANLARELGELDRRIAGSRLSGNEAAMAARFREALAGREKLFALGDELAAGAAAAAGQVTGAGLAAQPSPQLMGLFAPLELRFQGTVAEQTAVATGKPR
jgi:hypothetical protein